MLASPDLAARKGQRPVCKFPSVNAWLVAMSLWAVPVSIAAAEILLSAALAVRAVTHRKRNQQRPIPRVLWLGLALAVLEVCAWLRSPEPRAGWGEIRHLALIGTVLFMLPVLESSAACLRVWWGIIIAATVSSLFLIARFAWRALVRPPGADPLLYLRGGGLLHHWMVYSSVEILVFAALLELGHFFPAQRRWLIPIYGIHSVAIVLTLTRSLWFSCLLLLALHFAWTRSRWLWAVPVLPVLLCCVAPKTVRSRAETTADPSYYSNAERVQMLKVGWRMVRAHPIEGVGPGRVEALYASYLSPSESVPAYHGHLHNNAAELAAEFGLPVLAAAVVFCTVLLHYLLARSRFSSSSADGFLRRTAVLGFTGFLVMGMFDYTYGHSLGLILLCFVVAPPFLWSTRARLVA